MATSAVNNSDSIINDSTVKTSLSKTWSSFIPRTNIIIFVLSVILVFGLDLWILFTSWSLLGFWIEMLIVFGIFVFFIWLENYIFRKKFSGNKSKLDLFIGAAVLIRNLTFFLNFIPYIQLLGMFMLVMGGVPFLIIYIILLRFRAKVK